MSLPTASPPSSPDEEHPEPATTRASRRKPARPKRIKDVNYSAGYLVDDNLLDVIKVKTQAAAQWVVLRITAETTGLEAKAGSIQFGVILAAATDPAVTLEELSKHER